LKRKTCKLYLEDIEMQYFDFLKMKHFGVFGLFASYFPTVEIFYHFFSTFAHSLLKPCCFDAFCSITFGCSFAQPQIYWF